MATGFTQEQAVIEVNGEWFFVNLWKWRYKKLKNETILPKNFKEYGKFLNLSEFVKKYWTNSRWRKN